MAVEQRPPRRRVSQADVAKAAGVSPTIVSSVINNKSYGSIRIGDLTRQRVLDAVRELGYVPDPVARRMTGHTNRLIGVFTYESVFPMRAHSFYHEFLVGIEQAAEEADHDLLLVTGSRRERQPSLYARGSNGLRLADGGLLFGSAENTDEVVRLTKEGFPFVVVGERNYPGIEASYAAADYRRGTAALVHRAHELGHRRIAFAQSYDDPVPGRLAGFLQAKADLAMSADDAPVLDLRTADPWAEPEVQGVRAARAIVNSGATCVLLQGGFWLDEFWAEASRLGVSLPHDLSIILLRSEERSVDGWPVTELDIPRNEMGREAVRILLQLIDDPTLGPLRRRLPCGVREGATLMSGPRQVPAST